MENTLDKILIEYDKISAEYDKKKIEGEEFNVFHLINDIYGIGETKHSRFLAFILNPNSAHGQKDIFLKLFLKKLGINFGEENREWQITAEKDNVDILIQSNYPTKISVVIENKSNDAPDQKNQLYRYWHNHIYKFYDDGGFHFEDTKNCRVIYLTKGNWKVYSDNSIEKPTKKDDYFIKYKDCLLEKLDKDFIANWTFLDHIRKWLEECIKVENLSYRIRCFIEDYIKFWDDTKLKDEFYMEKLDNYFKDKENEWADFVQTSNYIQDVKNIWIEKFSNTLVKLNHEGWSFNSVANSHWRDDSFPNLKFNDFRWHLGKPENICFIYEFHKGLSIWKHGFGNSKKEFMDKFEGIFDVDFIFIKDPQDNYIMKLREDLNSKIVFNDDIEGESKLTWIAGNESEKILNVIQPILNKYMLKPEVIKLFKIIDKEIISQNL